MLEILLLESLAKASKQPNGFGKYMGGLEK